MRDLVHWFSKINFSILQQLVKIRKADFLHSSIIRYCESVTQFFLLGFIEPLKYVVRVLNRSCPKHKGHIEVQYKWGNNDVLKNESLERESVDKIWHKLLQLEAELLLTVLLQTRQPSIPFLVCSMFLAQLLHMLKQGNEFFFLYFIKKL
jgi:hypothetical protein